MIAVTSEDLVETLRESLLVLDENLTVEFANRSFYKTFRVARHATVGRRLYDLGEGQWDIPELRELLERIVPEHRTVEDYRVEYDFPHIGWKTMELNARKVLREDGDASTILLAIEDVTERARLEVAQREATRHVENLLAELSHRVMNSLSIISSIIAMEARQMDNDGARMAFDKVSARVRAVAELYRTLSSSRSAESVDARPFLAAIANDVMGSLDGRETRLRLECDIGDFVIPSREAVPLGLILNELLTNAIKYAFRDRAAGTVTVAAHEAGGEIRLSVSDDGVGVDEKARIDSGIGGRLVDMFAQELSGRLTRQSDGHGTSTALVFPRPPDVSATTSPTPGVWPQ